MSKREAPTKPPPGIPAEQTATYPPAVPPTAPGRVFGYGKLIVPPRPELKSAPAHEDTKHGVAPPAHESAPMPPPASPSPPKRSLSPPPKAEEAADPTSVRIARESAKAAAAAQDAIEAEQRRALKPSALSQLFHWFGTPRGKATLALVGTLASGAGWANARETILAAIGIESSAAAQAREDRHAKRLAEIEGKETDQAIKARELEQRLDRLKTTTFNQGNDIADLNRRVPEIKAKPDN